MMVKLFLILLLVLRATLVEPSVKCFDNIKTLHLNNDSVEAFNVAIANICGKLEFYESGAHAVEFYGANHSLLSSLKKGETEKWKNEQFSVTIVDAIDIKSLIKKSKFHFFLHCSVTSTHNTD